ncbi:MAG: cupredoxin domain-containing protein [Gemmatimonadaceae bacterium]
MTMPYRSPSKRPFRIAISAIVLLGACTRTSTVASPSYRPRTRAITVTTVPLLVKEQRSTFPFLAAAFARGGVLNGKEVYAFSPSTLTIVEGDTIQFTLINPEDDAHSFVLPDLSVSLPGNTTTRATYVARHAGIFPIVCAVPSHLPMMSGQLVVLPRATMADADSIGGAGNR